MTKTDIWMPLYIGDYLAATTHLSAEESGAYLHLLMHQWRNGSLPSDMEALRRIARVESDAWSNAWAILRSFFDHATGVPVQQRLESIRGEWSEKKDKSTAKAEVAAAARWKKNASSIPQAVLETCPSSSSSSTPNTSTRTEVLSTLADTAIAATAERGKLIGRMPLPGKDGGEYEIYEADAHGWQQTYPGVDVRQELRECKQWLVDNPNLRKTAKGIRRFINSWMAREQDKGGAHGTNRQQQTLGNRKADAAASALQRAFARIDAEEETYAGTGDVFSGSRGDDGRSSSGVVLEGVAGSVQQRH